MFSLSASRREIAASTRNWKKLREKVREQIMSRPPDERFVMGAQNVRRCNRSIEASLPAGLPKVEQRGRPIFESVPDRRRDSSVWLDVRRDIPNANLARNPHPLAKEKIFRAVAIRLGSEVADKNPRIPGRRDVSAECAAMRAERAPGKKLKD